MMWIAPFAFAAMLEKDPYRPPRTITEETPDFSPDEEPVFGATVFFVLFIVVVTTIVVMAILGNFAGTTIAKSLGMLHGELFDVRDFGTIKHWLGFVLLVVGAFVGAFLPERYSWIRKVKARKETNSIETSREAIRLLSPQRDSDGKHS